MHAQHIDFLDLLDGKVHYVVPRWQRRYRWDYTDIERLVEDLVTIAAVDRDDAAHYGGTLLTFTESGPGGVVKTVRVVDGQQRLTTVSLLLDCIANELGPDGSIDDWTAADIRDCLSNSKVRSGPKRWKLRLQTGDDEEYRCCLKGNGSGAGTVTAAWRTARRLVHEKGAPLVLRGLQRFRVVSIGLDPHEDPQQIFESLNATGRPLTETEKIKNWILMGLSDRQQEKTHDGSWLSIEESLGATRSTEPSDLFFRDLLRWKTGRVRGKDHVYEDFRRWAVGQQLDGDRPSLCRELARLANFYGILTGTNGSHEDKRVEKELLHMRAMGLDAHRSLTLRLLDDASVEVGPALTAGALAEVLAGINTWLTRLWLADRPLNAVNRAATDLAKAPGPTESEDPVQYWLDRLRGLRNTRAGVPDNEAVRHGIRTRRAYGGSSTRSTFAVLCALMEEEHTTESPARNKLTVEHIMPQKLTEAWRSDLGEDADEIHGQWRHRLANLTLTGHNPKLSSHPFESKCNLYGKSTIGMTSRLADCAQWDRHEMEQRAEDLSESALALWSWEGSDGVGSAVLRWRIEGERWHAETAASQMTLNVVSALLSRDLSNVRRLSGTAISANIHPASNPPTGHSLALRPVPGHEQFVLSPYAQDYASSAKRCEQFAKRCGVAVEIEYPTRSRSEAFWRCARRRTGGLPGQKSIWKGPGQRTGPYDPAGDWIAIYAGNPDLLWLYIRADEHVGTPERSERMLRCSRAISTVMSDQKLGSETAGKAASKGRSVSIVRNWARDDEDAWPEVVDWLDEQIRRLRHILARIPIAGNGSE